MSKTFRGPVNVIIPVEGGKSQKRSILGVKDYVGADEEKDKGGINKEEGRSKIERIGAVEESVSRASIRSVRISSTSITERISSETFPNLKRRSSIGFGGVVTNAGVVGVFINKPELKVEVIKE